MDNPSGQNEATPTSPTDDPVADEPQQPTQDLAPEGEDFETQTSDEVPEGVTSEHATKRFQDLTKRAKTAEQELEDLRQRKSVFDEFSPGQPVAPQPMPQYQVPQLSQFLDENNNVDVQKFDQAMQQYHLATQQMAIQSAQQGAYQAQQLDRRMQEKEAYAEFPELNPTKDQDPKFTRLVAASMAMDWANNINRPLVEIAREVAETYARKQTEEGIAKQAVEQYKEAQQNRATQGPMEKGRATGRTSTSQDQLKEISRRGSMDQQQDALAERLKRAGF